MEDGGLITADHDENPFSFKQFLKNQSGETASVNSSSACFEIEDEESNDIENDIAKEIPFPDIHQDQEDLLLTKTKGKDFSDAAVTRGKKLKQNPNKKQELSDPPIENPFSFKSFVKKDAAVKTTGRILQIIDNDIQEVTNCASENDVHDYKVNQCDVSSLDKDDQKPSEITSNSTSLNKELDDEIDKLRNENKKIRKELREAKKSKEDEKKRAASLFKKLKEFEEKENEETTALEKMVHMVEKNLELTTQRAVKVEAMNVKLREENTLLKNNSVSKDVYDDLLNKHHGCLSSIKDQAVSAAQHLDATAIKAEESLKQLYSGVDSFKLVSQLLSSIDKFTNLDQGQP